MTKSKYKEMWKQLLAVIEYSGKKRYSQLELLTLMSKIENQ